MNLNEEREKLINCNTCSKVISFDENGWIELGARYSNQSWTCMGCVSKEIRDWVMNNPVLKDWDDKIKQGRVMEIGYEKEGKVN